jgi:ABC-2 type transport system ATP-binding protein
MKDDIIKTTKLTKHFGEVKAVNCISLSVGKGEIYGFLGLNGAGKTTTIRMLLGMIRPTAGSAFLYGKKVNSKSGDLWEKVGYLVENTYPYPELTVKENIQMMCRLRQISGEKIVDKIISEMRLATYQDRRARELSSGNIQRLSLAKAFLHQPDILILDEPTKGLDPTGIVEIRERIRDLASNYEVTIFISSHILGEVSKFATRIGIIHEGQLIQELDIEQLEHLFNKRLLVNTRDTESAKLKLIQKGYSVVLSKDGNLEVKDREAVDHPDRIASILVHEGLPPTLLKIEEEDLEAYFLRIIGVKGK